MSKSEGRSAETVQQDTEETVDDVFRLSQILGCEIDRETVSILLRLTELGVNPEALALVTRELQREQDIQKPL